MSCNINRLLDKHVARDTKITPYISSLPDRTIGVMENFSVPFSGRRPWRRECGKC